MGNGNVHGLADDRAGRMQLRRHEGELVKVVEIILAAIAALAVEIQHIGCAIHRHENGFASADRDGAFGISRVHRVFGRNFSDERHELGAVDAHPITLHIGACGFPHGRGFVVAEVDAGFFEYPAGLPMDEFDCLIGHDVVERYLAFENREAGNGCGAQLTPALAPAGAPGAARSNRAIVNQVLDARQGRGAFSHHRALSGFIQHSRVWRTPDSCFATIRSTSAKASQAVAAVCAAASAVSQERKSCAAGESLPTSA